MPNFRNKYSDSATMTVRLSARDRAFLTDLANRSQTKDIVYLEELIEFALAEKRDPDVSPNFFQRSMVEAAVCAAGVEQE